MALEFCFSLHPFGTAFSGISPNRPESNVHLREKTLHRTIRASNQGTTSLHIYTSTLI